MVQSSEQSAADRGCAVVCKELLKDRRSIAETQRHADAVTGEFHEALDQLAKAVGIYTGSPNWWDIPRPEQVKKVLAKISILKTPPRRMTMTPGGLCHLCHAHPCRCL